MGFGIYSQDQDEDNEIRVASGPGVIRLQKVENSVETRDNQRFGPVSGLSFSVGKGASQLNTPLSPKTGELQRNINKTKRPEFAERHGTPGAPISVLAFSCGVLLAAAELACVTWNTWALELRLEAEELESQ
uniref:Uncharacterized protein n=1 Tax=Molossus molossus TaxID=27622 RepID=A0A7J8I0V2_MOLMO|nr:hypothetical protein HJG59_010793 [Molossus molossus]